jgi:hypothetical protein
MHVFLTSILVGGEWSASCPGRLLGVVGDGVFCESMQSGYKEELS